MSKDDGYETSKKWLKRVLLAFCGLSALIWVGLLWQAEFILSFASPCKTLEFPEPLRFAKADYIRSLVGGMDWLAFRQNPGRPAQIMVTAQSGLDMDLNQITYATQKYAFDLYRGGPLRKISEAEWETGQPVQTYRNEDEPIYSPKTKELNERLSGLFQFGHSRLDAKRRVSPDGRFGALASYTAYAGLSIGFPRYPDHGFFFWDVYDLNLRKRRFTVPGIFLAVAADEAVGRADWLPEGRLALTIEEQRKQFLYCDASE